MKLDKTTTDVIQRIDERIDELEATTGAACIEALANYGDREQYCEAIRKAAALQGVKKLRADLAAEFLIPAGVPIKSKRRQRVR